LSFQTSKKPNLVSISSNTTDHIEAAVADPGFLKRGFQLLAKVLAQFELKTKKKPSTFVLLSQQYVMHFHCIISNRTTVIKVS